MEITAVQFGRIEAACAALAKHAEHNEVATVLVNLIRRQLDELKKTAYSGELEPPPDLSPADAVPAGTIRAEEPARHDRGWTEEIRKHGRELLAQGAGIIPAIRMICGRFDLTQAQFAGMLGTSATTLSTALSGGTVRRILLARMAEFFGDGGLTSDPSDRPDEPQPEA